MTTREASDRRRGSDDSVIEMMKEHSIPITRENYLHLNYMGEIPDPWTAEHEAELPRRLQDWTKFKYTKVR